MSILEMFVINLLLAVIVSMIIVNFNSCSFCFWIHNDLSEHRKLLEFSKEYWQLNKTLDGLYEELEFTGILFSKVCLAIATFIDFFILPVMSIMVNPPQSTTDRILTLAIPTIIPTIILHVFVWYMNKQLKHYKKWKHECKGGESFLLTIDAMSNIDQYSYIENVHELKEFYSSTDSKIDLMKLRIDNLKFSISKHKKHVAKWLMFSCGFSVFSLLIVFLFGLTSIR